MFLKSSKYEYFHSLKVNKNYVFTFSRSLKDYIFTLSEQFSTCEFTKKLIFRAKNSAKLFLLDLSGLFYAVCPTVHYSYNKASLKVKVIYYILLF